MDTITYFWARKRQSQGQEKALWQNLQTSSARSKMMKKASEVDQGRGQSVTIILSSLLHDP